MPSAADMDYFSIRLQLVVLIMEVKFAAIIQSNNTGNASQAATANPLLTDS